MRRALILVLLSVGCGDVGESWAVTSLKDKYGPTLVECGQFVLTECEAMRQCMVQFVDDDCSAPTHFQFIETTVEGDPIATDYFLVADDETKLCALHEIHDPRADRFGSSTVSHRVCAELDVVPVGSDACRTPVRGVEGTCEQK